MTSKFLLCVMLVLGGSLFALSATASSTEVPVSTIKTKVFPALTNSVVLKIDAAADYLKDLKKLDRLPGVSTNIASHVTTGGLPVSDLKELRYPFSVTFLVSFSGQTFTNHYTAMQPEAAAAWQLKRAWRTDSRGRTVKEWPVSSVPRFQSTGSLKEIGTAISRNHAKFTFSATGPARTNLVPTTTTIVGATEAGVLSDLTNQVVVEIDEAATYLTKLKKQGRLPGIAKYSGADVGTGNWPSSIIHHFKYPFSITFYVAPTGASFTNHYTLIHPEKGAPWQLVKAWRTDARGRTIKEWQIK